MSDDIKPVPTVVELFGAKTKQLARFSVEPSWSAYNPSICYTEEHGYLVLLRSSNGWLKDHRPEWQTEVGAELDTADSFLTPSEWYAAAYVTPQQGSEKLFRNRMFIAKLNPSTLTLGKIREIDLTQAYKDFPIFLTRGIEDGRLYHDGTDLRISATIFEAREIGTARICNLKLDMSGEHPRGSGMKMYDSPRGVEIVEKNWMPIHKPSLYSDVDFDYIYDSGYTYSIKDQDITHVGGPELPVRGGSQLIGLENGTMLAVIHQCVSAEYIRFASLTKESLFRRRYVHRFIQYDDKGRILKVTDKFNFIDKSIEFAAGMALHNDKLLVTFGALDSSAHIASIPLKKVLSALRPPLITT